MFTLRHPTILLLICTLAGILSADLVLGADNWEPDASQAPRLLPPMDIALPISAGAAHNQHALCWQVIEQHTNGELAEASDTWRQMELPAESEIWRRLGLAVCQLYADNFDKAADHLAAAHQLDADNPAVHYFLGLENLARAERLRDTTGLSTEKSTAWRRELGAGRRELTLNAINDFERAINNSRRLDARGPLLPIRWVVQAPFPLSAPKAPPTVNDLLDALGADNYIGKSHALLVHLCLDQDLPDKAETHMDEAVRHGIPVPLGYRLIAEKYEAQGRSTDAFRAFVKAMKQGDQLAQPGATAIENMEEALRDLL